MKARQIIRSPKIILSDSDWQTGPMLRTAFPLSRSGSKAYKLGGRRWRTVELISAGLGSRVLISYRADIQEFQAIFGVDQDGDTKVIATVEHHRTHNPPWHAHVCCGPLSGIPPGVKRGPWVRRMGWIGRPDRAKFPTSDSEAFNRAAMFFRFGKHSNEGSALS